MARLNSVLDQPTWDQAWNVGHQLSLADAIRIAESLATRADTATPVSVELTDRQCEILRRLAKGETNREIAQALALSVATVERHLANIFARIGAKGRAAATLYAVRSGLVPSHRESSV